MGGAAGGGVTASKSPSAARYDAHETERMAELQGIVLALFFGISIVVNERKQASQ